MKLLYNDTKTKKKEIVMNAKDS